jgi:hypothetical protein
LGFKKQSKYRSPLICCVFKEILKRSGTDDLLEANEGFSLHCERILLLLFKEKREKQ